MDPALEVSGLGILDANLVRVGLEPLLGATDICP